MRGLCTKTQEFYLSTINALHFKIIALSETWLNNSINDTELFDLNQYNIFRKDRNFKRCNCERGGGVLLAVDRSIPATICDYLNGDNFCDIPAYIDLLIVKICYNFRNFYILVIYIPPHCDSNDYTTFLNVLLSLSYFYGSQLIVLGDFNCPDFVSCSKNNLSFSTTYQCIANFMLFYNLKQCNNILNTNGRLLDLILINKDNQCCVFKSDEPLLKEDHHHPALEFDFKIPKHYKIKFPTSFTHDYNFRKCNFIGLYEALSLVDWSSLANYSNIDDALSHFYGVLDKIFELYVPKKKNTFSNYPV